MKTKVINFFGSPGSGKSTHAAELFAHLKRQGINCELVVEYAKGATWRGAQNILNNQLYVFAKQHDLQFRLQGKVDYIITDSPLLMSLWYGNREGKCFHELVRDKWNDFDNVNFWVSRNKAYNSAGRNQTEEESNTIAGGMLNMLINEHIKAHGIDSDTPVEEIYRLINAGYITDKVYNHAYYVP